MGTVSANRFQRSFMIFENEDGGFEDGGKPSGHVMIEVREGKGRLETVIHNLRSGKGRFRYVLYLVKQTGDGTDYARIGEVTHTAGRAELKCGFDPQRVGGTVHPADQYDVAAVVVEFGDGSLNNIICPLAAYRKKTAGWRSGLRKALLRERTADAGRQDPRGQQPDLHAAGQADPVLHTAYSRAEPTPFAADGQAESVPYSEGRQAQPGGRTETVPLSRPAESTDRQSLEDIVPDDAAGPGPNAGPDRENLAAVPQARYRPGQETGPEQENVPERDMEPAKEQEWENEAEPEQEMEPEYEEGQDQQEQGNQPESEQGYGHGYIRVHESMAEQGPAPETEPGTGQCTGTAVDAKSKLNTECVYLNGNICDALVNNRTDPDPCGSCRINRNGTMAGTRPPGNIDGLICDLDMNFEVCDPFRSGRSDYKWWRVTNPVNLNNILYQNNIRSPLMFNPAVMLAHYRYKHLIIGIFSHKNGKRYVVCGVPGRHMEDIKPFGEMNRWVQVQGTRPRYGAFGYWLVYIDPDNGRILHPGK